MVMSKTNSRLQNYVDYLGLPMGILPAIDGIYNSMDGRIWMMDNSYAMGEFDSNLMVSDPSFTCIEKQNGVSRWEELSQCVEFHAKMASRCWIPTQFRFLNEADNMPRKFTVCWSGEDQVKREREYLIESLKDVKLKARTNPLSRYLRKLSKYLSRDSNILREKNEYVCLVICTHGVPTDENGRHGKHVVKEFLNSLSELAELPVKIIFRLTTDDDQVLEFFHALDRKIGCDVLDDFWGEAMEVYLHNPWLTYGIGIHRLREAGLGTDMMDDLDEKSFSLEEIRAFCLEFFIGKKLLSIRNPKVDIDGFIEDIQRVVDGEKLVWNPMKRKLCPWIDMEKLKLIIRRKSSGRQGIKFTRRCTMDPPPTTSFSAQRNRRDPLSASFHESHKATKNQRRSPFSASVNMGTSRAAAAAQQANYPRRKTHNSEGSYSTPQMKTPETPPEPDSTSAPKDLNEVIQQWSRVAPDYKKLKPLQTLLLDVPNLFPPTNSYVESHEHFFKWKEFSEDAFAGEEGDGLKELLRRASRKSKLFLHPDKLPSDLTDNQNTLFKSVWDVIQQSEAETFD